MPAAANCVRLEREHGLVRNVRRLAPAGVADARCNEKMWLEQCKSWGSGRARDQRMRRRRRRGSS